jgi:hypothetical protein
VSEDFIVSLIKKEKYLSEKLPSATLESTHQPILD